VSTSSSDPARTEAGGRAPRRFLRRPGPFALAIALAIPGVAVARAADGRSSSDVLAGDDVVVEAPSASGVIAVPTESVSPVAVEATRSELIDYFDELQKVVDSQQFAAPGDPQLNLPVTDMSAAVATARDVIDDLDDAELAQWQAIIDVHPGWSDQPDVLQKALDGNTADLSALPAPSSYRAPAGLTIAATSAEGEARSVATLAAAALAPAPALAPGDPDGIYSDCEISQPNIRGLFYSAWAATQVAGAAGAVASGIPDAADYPYLTIAAGVAFGVANGIAIGLNHALTMALDCAAAKDDAEFRKTLPTDPSAVTPTNPKGITPGSTQASVDELSTAVGGVATTLTTVDNRIVQVLADQLVVLESLGVANASATQTQSTAADLQTRSADLTANIGTATDAADEAKRAVDCDAGAPGACNTSNGLANTTDHRLDDILSATAAASALELRARIEQALAEPANQVVALFATPVEQGGHLELVREIVAETIANLQNAGQTTGNATAIFGTAEAAFAAGDHLGAYVEYGKSYRAAVG
jgi:hypothetical protein